MYLFRREAQYLMKEIDKDFKTFNKDYAWKGLWELKVLKNTQSLLYIYLDDCVSGKLTFSRDKSLL